MKSPSPCTNRAPRRTSLLFGFLLACGGASPQPEPKPHAPQSASAGAATEPAYSGGDNAGTSAAPGAAGETVLRVEEARAVQAWSKSAKLGKKPARRVRLRKLSETKASPVREAVDPAPRTVVARGMLTRWSEDFERNAPVSSLAPAALASRWQTFLQTTVPPHLRALTERFFHSPDYRLIGAYEDVYGPFLSVEQFGTADKPSYLALFVRKEATEAVSIFREHHRYTAVKFVPSEARADVTVAEWVLDLSALYPGVLEMEDAQLTDEGRLLVNAAYPSYAKEVGGQTAFLYAIDPSDASIVWRTPALQSRGDFVVDGDLVLSAYGFTAEPDYLYALDLNTGHRLARLRIPSAHDWLRLIDGKLHLRTYDADVVVAVERP